MPQMAGMANPISQAETAAQDSAGFGEPVDLLVDLLKLATFIAGPMRDGVAEPLGLSATDLRVILALGGEGELAGHDLSDIMGVPPMNVSRALAALLERGLVEPGEDRSNRRRKPFRLSTSGTEVFRNTLPAMAVVGQDLFADLNQRERDAFRRAARAITARMNRWTEHGGRG